jgi:hypothetical protein
MRIGRFGFGTWRQRMALERGTTLTLSQHTCSPRNGLQSWYRNWAGVAKRARVGRPLGGGSTLPHCVSPNVSLSLCLPLCPPLCPTTMCASLTVPPTVFSLTVPAGSGASSKGADGSAPTEETRGDAGEDGVTILLDDFPSLPSSAEPSPKYPGVWQVRPCEFTNRTGAPCARSLKRLRVSTTSARLNE